MVVVQYVMRCYAVGISCRMPFGMQGLDVYKRQGKAIVSSISRQMRESYGNRPDKVSADAGLYMFHYMISDGVVYMTLVRPPTSDARETKSLHSPPMRLPRDHDRANLVSL